MPYTVHTLDGQAHTYPETATLLVDDDGRLRVYDHVEIAPGPSLMPLFADPIAVYPAGQWTHYHVEPAPYETDAQSHEGAGNAQCEVQFNATVEGKDKWQAEFQRFLDAGRKAARAR